LRSFDLGKVIRIEQITSRKAQINALIELKQNGYCY